MTCGKDEGLDITLGGGIIGPQFDLIMKAQRLGQLDDGHWAGLSPGVDQVG